MSLKAKIKKATGKAKCMLCGKIIKKDLLSIHIYGFRTEGQIHNNPNDCECIR